MQVILYFYGYSYPFMRLTAFIIVVFISVAGRAQSTVYLNDLQALRSILEKTPSYKAQIKGAALTNYNALYNRLAAEKVYDPNDYAYFFSLSQLLFPLKDNHLELYQLPDPAHFSDSAAIGRFTNSAAFSSYPHYNGNIDSLQTELMKKQATSIEGVYQYDNYYSVGLFKIGQTTYSGVVLQSATNLWKPGQAAIHLYEFQPGLYKAIYGHPYTKNFILRTIEKNMNQSLVNSFFYGTGSQAVYAKHVPAVDHVNLPKNTARFALKHLDNGVQYLRLKSFQVNSAVSRESGNFSDSVKSLLKGNYLILDLRNNEGGAAKATRSYFSMIRKFSKTGHVYILINNGTLSQAEKFTLQLKKMKHVTTVGQTSKGMLSYGNNAGTRKQLPSGKFQLYITDMKGPAKLLFYEDRGIQPDIILDAGRDWIAQVLELIKADRVKN